MVYCVVHKIFSMIRAKDIIFIAKKYFKLSVLDSFLAVLTCLNVVKGFMLIL